MKAASAAFYFFLALLLSPYFLLLLQIPSLQIPDLSELWWALKNSTAQAALSAFGSFVLGYILATGSISWDRKFPKLRKLSEFLCLLPAFLPALFTLLTVISVLHPFVVGIMGVAFMHILMNAGLVALLLKSLFENKLGNYLEMASVQGSSQLHFLRNSIGLVRKDIFGIFIFVFILCFCSFAVPIMVGGGRATTIEILIYEKIRISGAWGEALALALFQMLFIFAISVFQLRGARNEGGRFRSVPLLGGKFSASLFFLYCTGFLVTFVIQSLNGFPQLMEIPGLWEKAVELIPASIGFSVAVGLVTVVLLLMTAYVTPNHRLQRLLTGFVSPSTALLGFSLLFVMAEEALELKYVLGMVLLFFSSLYRWGWSQELSGLEKQIETAQTLGAGPWQIFSEITFPQVVRPACRLSSIAALWALGDFSLGKILIGKDVTLALLIETLMSSYRIEASMALMGILMLLGLVLFIIFWGLGNVASRKSA